jgi:hypothetical protein
MYLDTPGISWSVWYGLVYLPGFKEYRHVSRMFASKLDILFSGVIPEKAGHHERPAKACWSPATPAKEFPTAPT